MGTERLKHDETALIGTPPHVLILQPCEYKIPSDQSNNRPKGSPPVFVGVHRTGSERKGESNDSNQKSLKPNSEIWVFDGYFASTTLSRYRLQRKDRASSARRPNPIHLHPGKLLIRDSARFQSQYVKAKRKTRRAVSQTRARSRLDEKFGFGK